MISAGSGGFLSAAKRQTFFCSQRNFRKIYFLIQKILPPRCCPKQTDLKAIKFFIAVIKICKQCPDMHALPQ